MTMNNNNSNDYWHDAHMLREHVLKRVESRPHLYNNLVVIIQELERNASILCPVEITVPNPPTAKTSQDSNNKSLLSSSSSSATSWTWFRTMKKASVAPLVAPSPVAPSPVGCNPEQKQSSSSSPKLYCKKAGRPTSHGRYQDLAAVDQILMEQSILDYYPQLEAKLIILRRRLQTEAVTLERCQSKWDAAMMLAPSSSSATCSSLPSIVSMATCQLV